MKNQDNQKKYHLVDPTTGAKTILNHADYERLKKQSEDKKYFSLHQNKVTNGLTSFLPLVKRKKECKIDLLGNKTVNIYGFDFQIINYDSIEKKININTSKLLTFIIMKLDLEKGLSKFDLNEYMEYRGVKDAIQLNREVIDNFDVINSLGDITYKSGKAFISEKIFKIKYNRRKGTINIPLDFCELLKKTYSQIPKKLFQMKGNAYLLGYHIYNYARINLKCSFNLKINTCLDRLTLPSYDDVKTKYSRHYDSKIIEPFTLIFDHLTEYLDDLNIEFLEDYKNINDFLNGYIKVDISSDKLKKCYQDIKNNQYKKSLKNNIENKAIRKKQALDLHSQGRTIKEISEILNLTPRTIKNYLLEDNSVKV